MADTHSAGFALFSWRLSVYEMWRAQDIGPPNVVVWTPVTVRPETGATSYTLGLIPRPHRQDILVHI
jgi:hypothetical protein